MQKIIRWMHHGWQRSQAWCLCHPVTLRVMMVLTTWLIGESAFADNRDRGAIPSPDAGDDPTQGGKDFLDIVTNMIKTQAGPLLVNGGALFFVVMAVFDIYRGYKKYQETDDFSKFKMALVTGAILIVIGLTLFFLGQHILRQWKQSNNP